MRLQAHPRPEVRPLRLAVYPMSDVDVPLFSQVRAAGCLAFTSLLRWSDFAAYSTSQVFSEGSSSLSKDGFDHLDPR